VSGSLRVGACQTPEILGDIQESLACVEDFAGQATARDVNLLVFPECFLQGYLVEPKHVYRHALDLSSRRFASVLRRLAPLAPTLVIGVIEQAGDSYFNTAVVVRRGQLVGAYRKTHLMPGERLFQPGTAYPTFALGGVRFGINICYDTQFPAAAAAVASQGARLLIVPSQNMMRRASAAHWKDVHHPMRISRVRETGMWLVSADVTGERNENYLGIGPTSIINPHGQIVAQVPAMTTGMVIADID
jgi:5-aminopentanamidase